MAVRMICEKCLTIGKPRLAKTTPPAGLGLLAALLGAAGFLFSFLWIAAALALLVGVYKAVASAAGVGAALHCRSCSALAMVPVDSPGGKALVARAQEIADRTVAPVAGDTSRAVVGRQ